MRVKAAYRIVLYAWESTMRLVQNQRVVQYNEPKECTHFYNRRIRHQGRSRVPCQMHVPLSRFNLSGRLLSSTSAATSLTLGNKQWMHHVVFCRKKQTQASERFAQGAAMSICWLWKEKLMPFSVVLGMKCALEQSCTCEGGKKTSYITEKRQWRNRYWQAKHDHQAGHMTGHQWKGNVVEAELRSHPSSPWLRQYVIVMRGRFAT